jgi:ligand-binding sensor domain-containing protein/two-component sensor histidine kinase
MFLGQLIFSRFLFRQSKCSIIALLFLLAEAATFCHAQSDFPFKKLSRENGLSGDLNAFMFRDSRGFMWISSKQGLNCFDGKSVRTYVYDVKNNKSLRGNNIQSAFFEDKKGDIWFVTSEAINVYRRERDDFDHFYVKDADGKDIKNEYYAFHLDASGNFWLRVGEYKNGKLYRFNTASPTNEMSKAEKHEGAILSDFSGLRTIVDPTFQDKGTHLISIFWGGKLGMLAYNYDENHKFVGTQPYFSGQKNDAFSPKEAFAVKQIVYDSIAKGFWLATKNGLIFWNRKAAKYTFYNTLKGEKITELTDIIIHKNQLFVSSKTHGVLVFDKNTVTFMQQILPKYTDAEGRQLKKIDNLFLDKEDNLWLASHDNGLFYTNLRRPKFELLRFPTNSLNTSTDNMIEDKDGNKWIARRGAGIVVFNRQHEEVTHFFSKNLTDYIKRLYRDREGVIWALSGSDYPAIYCFNPQNRSFDVVPFAKNQALDSIHLADICQISDGRLLIGTSKGVFEVNKSAQNPMVKKCQIEGVSESNFNVVDIFEDHYKTIFLNQNSQNLLLCRLEKKVIQKVKEVAINAETVGFIEQKGKLWLSSNKGLLVFQHDFEALSPLPSHLLGLTIDGLLPDTTGHFWLATSEGILNFDPETGNYHRFVAADLMQGYNFGRSALADTEGSLWFGGTNGINVFKPTEVKNFPFAPRPHITNILVNNVPYRPDSSIIEKKRLILPYVNNTVRLEFTAVEYSDAASDSISYSFNLADVTSEKYVWTTAANTTQPSISFVNLLEGDYVLSLRAVNSDGVQSEIRTLELQILPPWYRTWGFYGCVLAVLSTAIYFAVRRIIYQREKRLKEQAAFEQKIKETELKVLRTQMNPHFIGNALNSIRDYVLTNNAREASIFLADFAHLMRKILKYSTNETISLEKEAEILRGYLEMEQLRFDFEFDIQISDELDAWETEVPTMILQPFVENAVVHGVSRKKDGSGLIHIRFDKDGDFVLCSVTDNGIGRENSAKNKPKSHESQSQSITQDRLDILTQLSGKPTALTFENVETGGTKVTVRLPMKSYDD